MIRVVRKVFIFHRKMNTLNELAVIRLPKRHLLDAMDFAHQCGHRT